MLLYHTASTSAFIIQQQQKLQRSPTLFASNGWLYFNLNARGAVVIVMNMFWDMRKLFNSKIGAAITWDVRHSRSFTRDKIWLFQTQNRLIKKIKGTILRQKNQRLSNQWVPISGHFSYQRNLEQVHWKPSHEQVMPEIFMKRKNNSMRMVELWLPVIARHLVCPPTQHFCSLQHTLSVLLPNKSDLITCTKKYCSRSKSWIIWNSKVFFISMKKSNVRVNVGGVYMLKYTLEILFKMIKALIAIDLTLATSHHYTLPGSLNQSQWNIRRIHKADAGPGIVFIIDT